MAEPTAQLIRDTPALEALRADWSALWLRVPGATAFQSPDWCIPWWRHLGEGALLTVALRAADRLIGIVPLYVFTDAARRLFPIGIGTTDRIDALAEPDARERVMAAAFAALHGEAWDRAEWPQLAPDAMLLRPAPDGWTDTLEPAEPCAVLPLPTAPAPLPIPRPLARDLRNWRGRADRAGTWAIDLADAATLEAAFDALLRLHALRWEGRGEPGVLAASSVQAAHRAALPGLLRAGVLRLFTLHLDGAVIGALYGFLDRPGGAARRFHAYLGGFDPAYARLSPGSLLIAHAMAAAQREGAAVFDFLRGREGYKALWGAADEPLLRRVLVPRR